jgi:glycosyltransferase EpsH
MHPKVSIVVPIYNMERYLERCLDSLLAQRLQDIEIVAVDDGSDDRSWRILRAYGDRDARVRAFIQPNAGVSSARNLGIRMARGEYIGFVDPDDWVDPEMYDEMAGEADRSKADIVMCSYAREFGTHQAVKRFGVPDRTRLDGERLKAQYLRRLIGPLREEAADMELLDAWGTVWSKLYRADLIKENRLEFVDLQKIGSNEDTLFNIHAAYYANSLVFLDRPYYHYWKANESSITSGYKHDLLNRWFTLYRLIEDFLIERRLPEEYVAALRNRICLNTLGLGLNAVGSRLALAEKLTELRRILNDPRIREAFLRLDTSAFPMAWRCFYALAKYRAVGPYFCMLQTIDVLRKIKR